jgi:hypothetical protein
MHNVMHNCNSSRACGMYVRMRLAACAPKQAARRWLGQSGEFPHANNDGPGLGLDGPGAPPAAGPMRSQIAGSRVHAACSAKWQCADDAHAAILGKWWPMSRQDAVVTTTRCSLTPLRRSASAHQ